MVKVIGRLESLTTPKNVRADKSYELTDEVSTGAFDVKTLRSMKRVCPQIGTVLKICKLKIQDVLAYSIRVETFENDNFGMHWHYDGFQGDEVDQYVRMFIVTSTNPTEFEGIEVKALDIVEYTKDDKHRRNPFDCKNRIFIRLMSARNKRKFHQARRKKIKMFIRKTK